MPPYGGIVTQRNSIFARLIKNYGYNPIILTIKYDVRLSYFYNHDESLFKNIEDSNLKIIRINF